MSSYKLSSANRDGSIARYSCIILALIIIVLPLLACGTDEPEARTRDADYGAYGSDFAEALAQNFPRRIPGSDEEKGAAQYIFDQLALLGYSPRKQNFSYYSSGAEQESQNIIAKLDGDGFIYSPQFEQDRTESAPQKINDRILIVGAHYDTPDFTPLSGESGYVTLNTADGIHDNASGAAAVMVAAKEMQQARPGYNIHFVFFGSGTNMQEGAQAYLDSLSEDELKQIDAMVNIGPIYAGDKIYAHSGQNSVMPGSVKRYDMRRKLYQVTDIFFDYVLNTQNNYAVYTNQTDYFMPFTPAEGGERQLGLYREWTVNESDHTPFDKAGIPIVFIESGDYNVSDKNDLGQENTSPRFAPSKGMISGSLFDKSDYLEEFFSSLEEEVYEELPDLGEKDVTATETVEPGDEGSGDQELSRDDSGEDRLRNRINNTAFILVQLSRRGPIDYVFDQ